MQLEASELRPIVQAIRRRPGCSLLVFGCGYDSAFWERANANGTTAFIEDRSDWARFAKARLTAAQVHLVDYATRRAQWRQLLERPDRLELRLPAEIKERRWDIIVVDGPAGYRPWSPGRMKAIHAASGLIAPEGSFSCMTASVRLNSAFASRYLGDDRLTVEAKGRSSLRGYSLAQPKLCRIGKVSRNQ